MILSLLFCFGELLEAVVGFDGSGCVCRRQWREEGIWSNCAVV